MGIYDVVIIGGGPGGYVAAIRAAQLGLRTALVEKEEVGGVCLNWGCIPTKALLRNAEVLSLFKRAKEWGITCDNLQADLGAAVDRSRRVADLLTKGVRALLKKNQVEIFAGEGYVETPRKVRVRPSDEILETKNIILATGGIPQSLPGLEIDGQSVLGSRHALTLKEVPSSLLIIGGGPIGVEFAYFYNVYGSRVTIVEMLPHLLPLEDEEIGIELEHAFARQGINFLTNTKFQSIEKLNGRIKVKLSSDKGEKEVEADKVLVAVGVRGNIGNIGIEQLGVGTERSFIEINEKMQTNIPGIYAVGDVTGKLLLAHVASAQGEIAVETIASRPTRDLVYENMPRAVYCQPQVASFGLTEAEAQKRGYEVKIGRFPFRGNGKAVAMNEYRGMVKLVVDAKYGEILGAHLIGSEVTELLPELVLAQAMEVTHLEIAHTVHAHPTLSEALKEAALVAEGEAIHI